MAHDAVGILPPALQSGDTIAFISPSARLNRIFPKRIDRAKTYLESLGYSVKVFFTDPSPSISFDEEIVLRCGEIHSAFLDPDVKAILCTIGGISSNELLPHLDYSIIRENPKIFCGYSDITVLHHAIFTQAGLRTFYGPAAITQFGEFPQPLAFTLEHFLKVLGNGGVEVGKIPRAEEWTEEFRDWGTGDDALRPRHMMLSPGWTWLRRGCASGRLFGGCLPSLLQIAGTKYSPTYKNRILLLENPEGEIFNGPLPLPQTRSFFADLVNHGIISQISGLVIGRPYKYDDGEKDAFKQMVLDQCRGTTFPILYGVDVGHTDPILTIPLNALVRLDTESDEFVVLEAGVA